jgi:hypothetical protein
MPNGGPDNCGFCQFNPSSWGRRPGQTVDFYLSNASCEIRAIEHLDDPAYTYCANYHTGSRRPDGPVFAGIWQGDRLPWHGREPVRDERLAAGGFRLAVRDDGRPLLFDDPAAYLAWWRSVHPDEVAEYPWALHDAAFDPAERAAQREPRGWLARLRAWRRH